MTSAVAFTGTACLLPHGFAEHLGRPGFHHVARGIAALDCAIAAQMGAGAPHVEMSPVELAALVPGASVYDLMCAGHVLRKGFVDFRGRKPDGEVVNGGQFMRMLADTARAKVAGTAISEDLLETQVYVHIDLDMLREQLGIAAPKPAAIRRPKP